MACLLLVIVGSGHHPDQDGHRLEQMLSDDIRVWRRWKPKVRILFQTRNSRTYLCETTPPVHAAKPRHWVPGPCPTIRASEHHHRWVHRWGRASFASTTNHLRLHPNSPHWSVDRQRRSRTSFPWAGPAWSCAIFACQMLESRYFLRRRHLHTPIVPTVDRTMVTWSGTRTELWDDTTTCAWRIWTFWDERKEPWKINTRN